MMQTMPTCTSRPRSAATALATWGTLLRRPSALIVTIAQSPGPERRARFRRLLSVVEAAAAFYNWGGVSCENLHAAPFQHPP